MKRNRWWTIGLASVALLGTGAQGCSTKTDVTYNRFRTSQASPTTLELAEVSVKFVETALDNLDERMENGLD